MFFENNFLFTFNLFIEIISFGGEIALMEPLRDQNYQEKLESFFIFPIPNNHHMQHAKRTALHAVSDHRMQFKKIGWKRVVVYIVKAETCGHRSIHQVF